MNEIIKDTSIQGVRVVETGAPEGSPMLRYARLADAGGGTHVVVNVVESHIDPDGVGPEWVLCGNAGQGWTTVDMVAFTPPEPPAPVADPCEWLIDLGPFYDRFGAAKMAVLTSADAGVKAIMADLNIRKWVDLKRADVATGLSYVGTKVAAVDAALQDHILTTPVALDENRAVRKLYF